MPETENSADLLKFNAISKPLFDGEGRSVKRKKQMRLPFGRKWSWLEASSLDCYLAADIASGVEYFRNLDITTTPHGLTDEEWDQILAEIVWTFRESIKDYPGRYKKKHGETYDSPEYKARIAAYEKRIEHGKRLFVDHLQDLVVSF